VNRKPFSYTFGEFIDKLAITSKKDLANLPGARQELNEMMDWLKGIGVDAYYLLSIVRITQSNMDIWNLEHKMRQDNDNLTPLHIIGTRAIQIREHNKTRVRYKNELDRICGDSHVEEKIRHLSEETYGKFYSHTPPATSEVESLKKGSEDI